MPSQTVRAALVLIAIVAAGAGLYWLKDILTPLALAVFLMVMIDGLARGVRKVAPFVSEAAALPAALVLIVVAFMGAAWVIADGFAAFAARSGQIHSRLDTLVAQAAALLRLKVAPTVDQLLGQLDQPAYIGNAAAVAQAVASATLFVLIYLGFLMASRAGFQRKAFALFAKADLRQEARTIINRIRDGVESYVWIQTVTGLMIAIPAFVVLEALGMENAGFWAFVIFLFNFVPIIGGVIAVLGPALFALVQFPGYAQALVLIVCLPVILLIVGNIVFPRMQAKSQNIDPVVVLLSFAFWGALWGPTGAFLSTPLTVMAIAICAEFPGARWVAILFSADGQPYPEAVEPPVQPRPVQPRPSLLKSIRKKIIQS
jgi:AI-2 transport protein TqsA